MANRYADLSWDAPRSGPAPRGKSGRSWSGRIRSRARRCLVLAILAFLTSGAAAPQALAPDANARRIVVSLQQKRLWLVAGQDTLLRASVAIGRRESFRFRGRTYEWQTPQGERVIRDKRRNPVWTVPDWHYYERAANEDLELVEMVRNMRYPLADGSRLEVRGEDVVRIVGETYWKVPRGREIIIDGRLYMPPRGTQQRRVPGVLGTRALDMGDGYLIHGTHELNSWTVGNAASHGCIRMDTDDLERLFELVAVGTPVLIY